MKSAGIIKIIVAIVAFFGVGTAVIFLPIYGENDTSLIKYFESTAVPELPQNTSFFWEEGSVLGRSCTNNFLLHRYAESIGWSLGILESNTVYPYVFQTKVINTVEMPELRRGYANVTLAIDENWTDMGDTPLTIKVEFGDLSGEEQRNYKYYYIRNGKHETYNKSWENIALTDEYNQGKNLTLLICGHNDFKRLIALLNDLIKPELYFSGNSPQFIDNVVDACPYIKLTPIND
jgi:hypothetical protein